MTHISIFNDTQDDSPNTYILISLLPRYYHAVVIAQTKQYEYRRGTFVREPVTAFVYSTLSKNQADKGFPRGEVGGVVRLGTPVVGLEETIKINESKSNGSRETMLEWLDGFSTASAHPIESVHQIQEPITLTDIRESFPQFQPPQKYLVLNRNQPLLTFLKERSGLLNLRT